MILHIQIDDVLKTWVRRWASYKGVKGYPSLQSFMREAERTITRYSISELSEADYLRIDSAVQVLHDTNLSAYQVLMAVFLQGQSKQAIRDAMGGMPPTTYDNYLRTAKDFMSGAFFGSMIVEIKL